MNGSKAKASDKPQTVPVILLSGFLGSGKTTLINEILKHPSFAGSAVIVNEFGSIALDQNLIQTAGDHILELANGCICCSLNNALAETVEAALAYEPRQIILETTGLADPLPVMQSLNGFSKSADKGMPASVEPALVEKIRFDRLITVFDAVNGQEMLEQYQEARKQIALADLVLVSKLDLVKNTDIAMAELRVELEQLNSIAEIVDSRLFLGMIDQFMSSTRSVNQSQAMGNSSADDQKQQMRKNSKARKDHASHHHHENRIEALTIIDEQPMTLANVELFFELLLSAHGQHIPRFKGLIRLEDEEAPLLVHGVAGQMSLFELHKIPWPDNRPETQMVIFVDGIKPDFVRSIYDGFIGNLRPDLADRQGLSQNPLAIDGFQSGFGHSSKINRQ